VVIHGQALCTDDSKQPDSQNDWSNI